MNADKFSVLLAKKYDGADPTGLWASDKLDGVRAYWNGHQLLSRNGNPFDAPKWMTDLLPADLHLDGELYAGPGMFHVAVGAARSKGAGDTWRNIKFMVFDAPSVDGIFLERFQAARDAVLRAEQTHGDGCPVQIVTHTQVRSERHLWKLHRMATATGIEGTMLRDPHSTYHRRRHGSLMKIKDHRDSEAVVISHKPGLDKGSYVVRDQRRGVEFSLAALQPARPGATVTYRFQELTRHGVPRHPVMIAVRDYE